MARDTSSGLSTDGGKPYCRAVNNYSPPQGPINQGNEGPGLRGGTNTGSDQRHSHDNDGGSPGLHGQNLGNKGSQGRH